MVDCGRDFQTLLQDGLLALKTDVAGPLNETREVALGLDSATNLETASILGEEVLVGGVEALDTLLGVRLGLGSSCFRGLSGKGKELKRIEAEFSQNR